MKGKKKLSWEEAWGLGRRRESGLGWEERVGVGMQWVLPAERVSVCHAGYAFVG